jgi:hypothetical protein
MKRAVLTCSIAALLIALASCSPCLAAKTTLSASSEAIITAPDWSETRLMVDFDMPEFSGEDEIYHAEITFRMSGLEDLTEVELYELSYSWSPGTVEWSSTWAERGEGIRTERLDSWIADDKTGDLVKFIVTGSVRDLAAGERSNHGYIVVCTNGDHPRLTLPSEGPTLRIYYGPQIHE